MIFRRLGATSLLLALLVPASEVWAEIRIVNCDAPVQSRKRGMGVNTMSAADFRALEPGVSWYYNWGTTPLSKPSDVVMDFLPMAWNGDPSFQTGLTSYLAAGNKPWKVMALNEPNWVHQAAMTPSNAAVTFKKVKAICDPYNIPVIAPHMMIGTAASESMTGYDPIMQSNYVYTFQEPYISAFLSYCGSSRPTGISSHSYAGYGEITWLLNLMHTDFPTQTVWLTEFNANGSTSDAGVLATLIPAVDFCERTSWVEGYAWFMSRITGDNYNSLLTTTSGVLTAAGQAYVQMPVHDTNLYYRIPGRLQAERYVALNKMDISPTTDTNGLADMKSTGAAGSLDYNIQVDTAGNYTVNFRVAGALGQISIYKGATLLGYASVQKNGWSTVSTTVSLPSGSQTLHVVLASNAQQLNWMEFQTGNVVLPLALNKAVTVSSVENVGSPGSYAVDGDTATRWSSAFTDTQWIYVDLQAIYNITRVILNWESAYGKSYQIQVSTNAVNWTPIYSTTSGAGGIENLTGLSGAGRYVRMYGTLRSTTYGYSLWEFQIFGTLQPPKLAIKQSGTTMSVSWPSNGNFNLYSTTNLTAPIVWSAVTNSVLGTTNQTVTPRLLNQPQFFQLRSP